MDFDAGFTPGAVKGPRRAPYVAGVTKAKDYFLSIYHTV